MRSDQAILDEDEDSVGDYISGHHRNDSVAKTLHPSNEKEISHGSVSWQTL